MNVTFSCSHCQRATREQCAPDQQHVTCRHCDQDQPIRRSALVHDDEQSQSCLSGCLVCHSDELFIRKDFSQRLGLLIIISGFVASSIAWYFYLTNLSYGILLATALVDVLLYQLVGNLLQCYRCHSEYRGISMITGQEGFDLVIHERYRQQEARLQQAASREQGDI